MCRLSWSHRFSASPSWELGFQVSSAPLQVDLDTAWSIFSELLMTLRANKHQKQAPWLCAPVRDSPCPWLHYLALATVLLLPHRAAVGRGVQKRAAVERRMGFLRLVLPFCLASPSWRHWCNIALWSRLCGKDTVAKRGLEQAICVGSHLVI